jgi:hypothetical protein
MKASAMRTLLSLALALWGVVLPGRPDVLIGTNGERFAGRVLEETTNTVVFDSELAGRLTIPRSRIQEIQRITPAPQKAPNPAPAISDPPPTRLPRRTWPGGHLELASTAPTGSNSSRMNG